MRRVVYQSRADIRTKRITRTPDIYVLRKTRIDRMANQTVYDKKETWTSHVSWQRNQMGSETPRRTDNWATSSEDTPFVWRDTV